MKSISPYIQPLILGILSTVLRRPALARFYTLIEDFVGEITDALTLHKNMKKDQ